MRSALREDVSINTLWLSYSKNNLYRQIYIIAPNHLFSCSALKNKLRLSLFVHWLSKSIQAQIKRTGSGTILCFSVQQEDLVLLRRPSDTELQFLAFTILAGQSLKGAFKVERVLITLYTVHVAKTHLNKKEKHRHVKKNNFNYLTTSEKAQSSTEISCKFSSINTTMCFCIWVCVLTLHIFFF